MNAPQPPNDEATRAIAAALQWFPGLSASGLPPAPPGALVPEQVTVAINFLRQCTQTAKPKRSSYGLKHEAEACGGYISNGELIAAAVWLGFKVHPIPNEKNVLINAAVPLEVRKAIERCRGTKSYE